MVFQYSKIYESMNLVHMHKRVSGFVGVGTLEKNGTFNKIITLKS